MSKNFFVPKVSFLAALVLYFGSAFAQQDCKVAKESLQGTYTGDCKKGKANGKGKAVGTDTYEGEFKSGLPDGEGTYTWKDGSVYTGHFSKGMMDGKGNLVVKRPEHSDSIVDGYWKKDSYIGKNEYPYKVYSKTGGIYEMEFDYKRDDVSQIIFNISNTAAGGATFQSGSRSLKVDDIQMYMGSIGRMDITGSSPKRVQTTVYNVNYPARMKVVVGGDDFDVEFREPGKYTVNVNVNR
ncbi:MAG: hypothetical protein JSS80_01530 [Bacteroidetes bacterium]|nr:hypothetical protein [Bacteroidota bacterium]